MINTGKCPGCQEMIAPDLRRGPIGNQGFGPLVVGFIAVCPRCQTILGVLSDPDNIAAMVMTKLKKVR